ncbi:hypothetical protein C8J56DRAFT_187529 [Mycena floridula]|nr:hypothetical protein C8J56DRAFT_187529 [Mycena floridula]
MTGRIVMSSYESLKAAGTNVVCLSPWGDSSPLLLPCIRFRDLAVHTVVAATGGMAAVAAPVMGPISDLVVSSVGDTILVEIGLHAGFSLADQALDDVFIDKPINKLIPIHSKRLETTGTKEIGITLKYKHAFEDAALGFYRSSIHKDNSLFAAVKDYLAIEKGWFSPYLFASGRRPIIPRSMKPDVIFCHGPFLQGDYKIGETLLKESAMVVTLSQPSPPETPVEDTRSSLTELKDKWTELKNTDLKIPTLAELKNTDLKIPTLSNVFSRSRSPSPEPQLTPLPPPAKPRRMVILLVGLKPHRKLWTTSARPGESVINYILLNGTPSIVIPVKVGAPLLAWDGLTLEQLWQVELPADGAVSASGKFEGIVNVLTEFLEMCVDWDRFVIPGHEGPVNVENGQATVKDAMRLLVAAAIRSKDSKEAKKEIDKERSGIAMWRIP